MIEIPKHQRLTPNDKWFLGTIAMLTMTLLTVSAILFWSLFR